MSMPELPEGLSWKVEAVGATTINVSIHINEQSIFPSIGGESLSLNAYDNEAGIVTMVEGAAKKVYDRLQREIYVRSIVQRNWP